MSQRSIIHLLTVTLGAVLIHWTIYAAAETASPDQALSDILKSLETLRSTPDSLVAVRKLLIDEENRLETGLAETAAEIERLKAAIIEAERNRDALQGRLAALQTGRALLSGPAGDPAGTEPPPANPPEVEQPAPSGPPPKESEDEQPPKQTLLTALEEKVDFERDIRPIIINNCFACHGPDPNQRKGDLRLDRREDLVRETEGGRHIVAPGDPSKSELYRRITLGEDPDLMPPKSSGKELKPEQVELIRKWIEQGAEWAGHWAYIPPKRPPLPTVNNSAWVRNEIDAYILARLEQEGLSPSPEAPKHTLIRRLSFDLIGLPPRPDEVSAFLADNSPEAYEKVVDRLLASRHYGERMAQQWLDLSRYADSDGYHADFTRSLWQYRDWVINAFNANKPFDEFTVEQLAGDLLPRPTLDQKVATAFNRNGMTNTEGGADAAEYATKYVIDRVNTTSTVWLGISMGCCECHNHKFDPFTQREFYQLYDFFNQLPEAGLDKDPCPPFMKLPSNEQKAEMERLTAKAGELESHLAAKVAEESPELDRLQGEWESRLLAGTLHIPGFNLSHWSVVGPFPARTQDEAFSNEYGPERGV
ncbi:MAG: DUF1549 domain-containing protein, partial [Candidatus Omnitrophica bacterium]|nr:DUF1549 domain-containing protein [Candidatus Omnitrophota bacterium]